MGKGLTVGVVVVIALLIAGGIWYTSRKTSGVETVTEPVRLAMSSNIKLTIASPINGAKVATTSVEIKGKTTPGADVSINEVDTNADAQGDFSGTVQLDEGDNYIEVMAIDESGEFARQEITVTSQTFE